MRPAHLEVRLLTREVESIMDTLSRHLVRHAEQIAREVAARAVVVYADAIGGADEVRQVLQAVTFPTILVSRCTEVGGMQASSRTPGFACPTST